MLIHGSCHCGNIRFTLDWLPDPAAGDRLARRERNWIGNVEFA
jgi:hypothetical protein